MSVHFNPRIVTTDLVQAIDFGVPRCLPAGHAGTIPNVPGTVSGSQNSGTGTNIFYDLSGRRSESNWSSGSNTNYTIAQNGVSWNGTTASITDIAGYFRSTTSGANYGWATDPGNGTDQSESSVTIEMAFVTSDDGYLSCRAWNGSGQYNYGIYPNGFFFFAGATSSSMSAPWTNNGVVWHIAVWANETQIGYYVNGGNLSNATGATQASQSHGISNGGTPSSGYSVGGTQWGTLYPYGHGWGGNEGFTNRATYHFVRWYRRKLTDSEVYANFLATRNRLGL